MFLSIPQFIPALFNIMFAWTYHPNVSMFCYRPSMVFKKFDIAKLNMVEDNCICQLSKRFSKFIDMDTSTCTNEGKRECGHVRTMDLSIIQHKGLRHALKMGLNQIPLRPTIIHEAIQVVHDTFLQVCEVLNITHIVDMDMAIKEVRHKMQKSST